MKHDVGARWKLAPFFKKDVVEIDLPTRVNDENFVSIGIKPTKFSFDKTLKFYVEMNTHQGSLDFDLTRISLLKDDKDNVYKPLGWEGPPPGGHHRSGTLTFPKLEGETKFIELTMRNVYNVSERAFRWELG